MCFYSGQVRNVQDGDAYTKPLIYAQQCKFIFWRGYGCGSGCSGKVSYHKMNYPAVCSEAASKSAVCFASF